MSATATSGVQTQDMGQTPRAPWPHWTLFQPNTHEFIDPKGDRTIRVVAFERLVPGGESTVMCAPYVPSHPNSYDVLSANLKLPLPGAAGDPVDPIGGVVMLRPECLFWKGPGAMPAQPPATDHIQVNIFVHSDGPSGEPMINLSQMAEMVAKLEGEHPGRVRADKGEFLAADGTVHELLETCWETLMGRPFRYPDPPRLDVPLMLPVTAYPWRPSRTAGGVSLKPFLSLGPGGPTIRLAKLDAGANLPAANRDRHRLIAVLAGALGDGGATRGELSVVYAPPGEAFGTLVAERPSLLWLVDWQPKTDPLASFWEA